MTETIQTDVENPISDIDSQIATFQIGNELFGIGIHRIKEIVRYPEITSVPRAANYLKGLANLRGTVLPIIDSRVKLGMEQSKVTDATRILVLDAGNSLVGVIVDSVKGVSTLDDSIVEPPPEVISSGIDVKFIKSIIRSKKTDQIILELEVDSLTDIKARESKQQNTKTDFTQTTGTKDNKDLINEKQLVTFLVAKEEYGFPIDSVREVLRVGKIVEVPEAPEFVLGIISLRNTLLPIVDIRKLYKMPSLVQENLDYIDGAIKNYRSLINTLTYNSSAQKFQENELVSRKLGKWIEDFRTSSELIGKSQQEIRFQNLNLQNLILSKNLTNKKEEIESQFKLLQSQLEILKTSIAKDIHEDQRILVTDIGEMVIGILVDRMQQVIRVHESTIDPPPKIVGSNKTESLKGIVKLDKGERLILLLDENKLFDENTLKRISMQHQSESSKNQEQTNVKTNILHDEEVQLVTFTLGHEEFGIWIEDVREINRLSNVTAIPRTPAFVEGVMNLRGNVVPAIDLRKRFGMETAKHNEQTRVMIVDISKKLTGLIVDSVSEVLRVSKKRIEIPPEVIRSNVQTEFIENIVNLEQDGRFIIIINVNKILTMEESEQLHQHLEPAQESNS